MDRTVIDELANGFVVRRSSDDSGPLAALAQALTAEPGRVWIVAAPSITVRHDLYSLLASVIEDRLTQSAIGVRLLCLGPIGEPAAAESALRTLADRTGRALVGNLGTGMVGSDGTVAVTAQRGARGGWAVCAPGVLPVYDGAWFPVPWFVPANRWRGRKAATTIENSSLRARIRTDQRTVTLPSENSAGVQTGSPPAIRRKARRLQPAGLLRPVQRQSALRRRAPAQWSR